MNTLVAVSIAPCGIGDEFAPAAAQAIKIIRDSGLPSRTTSMFTEIEGEWDDVMKTVKEAAFAFAEKGIRTEIVMKVDIRPGYTNMMDTKVEKVETILSK